MSNRFVINSPTSALHLVKLSVLQHEAVVHTKIYKETLYWILSEDQSYRMAYITADQFGDENVRFHNNGEPAAPKGFWRFEAARIAGLEVRLHHSEVDDDAGERLFSLWSYPDISMQWPLVEIDGANACVNFRSRKADESYARFLSIRRSMGRR